GARLLYRLPGRRHPHVARGALSARRWPCMLLPLHSFVLPYRQAPRPAEPTPTGAERAAWGRARKAAPAIAWKKVHIGRRAVIVAALLALIVVAGIAVVMLRTAADPVLRTISVGFWTGPLAV